MIFAKGKNIEQKLLLASDNLTRQGLDILNPVQYSDWNDVLLKSSDYSIFHTSNWAIVLYESYGFIPYYFVHIDGNIFNLLLPIMEVNNYFFGRRAISLPFTDYCQPIYKDELKVNDIFIHLSNVGIGRKWKTYQLRNKGEPFKSIPPCSSYFRHYLKLHEDEDAIFRGFRDNYRAKIKKCLNKGVTIRISQAYDDLKIYYELHCHTRKRIGLPPQPYKFFKNIYKNIISKKLGFVALAEYNNKKIAGAVFFHFGEKAVYKYGASDKKYDHLFPNHLLFWSVIQWLCRNGYKELCFGRSELSHHGLIQFKDGWGAEKQLINYYEYDVRKKIFIQRNNESKVPGYFIFKILPLPVSRIIGSFVYRFGA